MYVLALRLALSHLRQKLFSRFVVVMSVACILLMNGLVFLLFKSFSNSLAEVRASQYMTVYIDSAVTASHEGDVLSAVKKVPGVASAQLVSKDIFLENFSRYFPQLSTELSALDADTIPRYVKVKVAPDVVVAAQDRMQRIRGVEMVEVNRNKYSGLIAALVQLRKLALVLIGGMSLALLCILLNHFKLGSAFQNQVRQTLSVLGARKGYMLLPFAIEGLVEGALGGLFAAAALLVYGRVFESQMNSLFTAIGYHPYHFQLVGLAIALAMIGTLSGMIGSLWATFRAQQ